MKSAAVELLRLLLLTGIILCDGNGPAVIRVTEGSDVVLPCSLSTKENIESKRFDWRKDGQKEVFLYDAGIHYNNGRSGQDEQFKGRVSHFKDELKFGSASIIIRNTKLADSGDYTCNFPHLQPERRIFHIQLVVGAASEPCITILDETKGWSLLQCVVRGASPEPKVEWQDSAGNILPAEEPQVSERGGSYDITLQTTVTKTDRYRCVVTQEEIKHQTHAETSVYISEPAGLVVSVRVVVAVVATLLILFVVVVGVVVQLCIKPTSTNGQTNIQSNSVPLNPKDPERVTHPDETEEKL